LLQGVSAGIIGCGSPDAFLAEYPTQCIIESLLTTLVVRFELKRERLDLQSSNTHIQGIGRRITPEIVAKHLFI
jgi:hypothetical protein